jgi:hypothetical protein
VLCILILFFFQALVGVYAKEVHVRLACLSAIKCVPVHSVQRDLQVSTSLWIAAHDPEKVCNSFPTKFDMELLFLSLRSLFFLHFDTCTFSRWLLN